jgi:hypothetical protein
VFVLIVVIALVIVILRRRAARSTMRANLEAVKGGDPVESVEGAPHVGVAPHVEGAPAGVGILNLNPLYTDNGHTDV